MVKKEKKQTKKEKELDPIREQKNLVLKNELIRVLEIQREIVELAKEWQLISSKMKNENDFKSLSLSGAITLAIYSPLNELNQTILLGESSVILGIAEDLKNDVEERIREGRRAYSNELRFPFETLNN